MTADIKHAMPRKGCLTALPLLPFVAVMALLRPKSRKRRAS